MDKCPQCGAKASWSDFYCENCGAALTSPKRPRTKQYRSNIQIIGIAEIVLGFFNLLGAGILGVITAIFPRIMEIEEIQAEITDPTIWELVLLARYLLIIIVIFLLLYGIFSVIFGALLLQYRSAGRVGTMIMGALSLINAPLGTIFGIGALYVLTRPEAEALFN